MYSEYCGGWVKISCEERDTLMPGLKPYSSLTDPHGEFGTPVVFTEWGEPQSDRAVLRDYLWPSSSRPCEHYRAEEENQ